MPIAKMTSDVESACRLLTGPWRELEATISRAIAEERERCAKVAESFKPGFCGDDKDVQRFDLADAIAAKIRSATIA